MLPYKDYKQNRATTQNTATSILPNVAGSIRLKAIFLSLFLLIGLVFTQLVFANNLATGGEKLSNLQQEINNLERENMTLKTEIAKVSALSKLSADAKDKGFIMPQKVTVVD